MPIYEFICSDCGRGSSFLTRSVSSPLDPVCRSCGSANLQRAISSFAVRKTVKQVHDQYGPTPRNPDMSYYEDHRNIGRNVEEAFQRYDMTMPSGVQETIDAAREGALPGDLDL